jgi:hypothetical protein
MTIESTKLTTVLQGAEERLFRALTTIGVRYGLTAVERCRALIASAPPSWVL